jgi:hypothetical protein
MPSVTFSLVRNYFELHSAIACWLPIYQKQVCFLNKKHATGIFAPVEDLFQMAGKYEILVDRITIATYLQSPDELKLGIIGEVF